MDFLIECTFWAASFLAAYFVTGFIIELGEAKNLRCLFLGHSTIVSSRYCDRCGEHL